MARLFAEAGLVGWALALFSAALWTLIPRRILALRRGAVGSLPEYTRAALRAEGRVSAAGVLPQFVGQAVYSVLAHRGDDLDRLARLARTELSRYRDLIRVLVLAAPLLGLLGTVGGMVETLASLHASGSSQLGQGRVVGGIQSALVSTQLGLAISIPGFIASILLNRREMALQSEIEQVRALCAQAQVLNEGNVRGKT